MLPARLFDLEDHRRECQGHAMSSARGRSSQPCALYRACPESTAGRIAGCRRPRFGCPCCPSSWTALHRLGPTRHSCGLKMLSGILDNPADAARRSSA
jgi:hypothetical protein